jgi:hypothetical protein
MQCPKCKGTEFWDNRTSKKNPNGPDYRCKERDCGGAIWLTPKGGAPAASPAAPPVQAAPRPGRQEAAPSAAAAVDDRDIETMRDCLAAGIELTLSAIRDLDIRAPGNDIAFTSDNICSIAAGLFIQTTRKARER